MPELPDVEILRRYFDRTSLNQPVAEVLVKSGEMVKGVFSPEELVSQLKGQTFSSTLRHGKYLFAEFDAGWLVLHFGMTGTLAHLEEGKEAPEHTRFLLRFRSGTGLAYQCQRKLGGIYVIDSVEGFIKEQGLGPDALQIELDEFKKTIGHSGGSVKSALMNQAMIAGIGNIYSDEIMYQVKIHPKVRVAGLDDTKLEKLYEAVRHVLETAIEAGADPSRMPEHYLLPIREKDGSCPRCGTRIEAAKISGRTGYYCPGCQVNQ
ncbi:MAG: DNA-formamidopyrimidine glycosylase family protein [Dehalococcoidia bacterium]